MKNRRTNSCGLPSQQSSACKQSTRGGVTLTEVLMSLLVMGIGVTTVATLFPLSIIRSVQGTQLTNAALLRYNAEALIDINRDIIHDPDGDYDASTNPTGRTEHFGQTYVVDPLGYHLVTGQRNSFGNGGLKSLVRFVGGDSTVLTQAVATELVVLPDSWVTKIEDTVPPSSGFTDTSVNLEETDSVTVNQISFPTATNPEKPPSRVVLTDTTGEKSIIRFVSDTVAGAPTIVWTDEDTNNNSQLDAGEDLNGNGLLERKLPAGFNIGKVRVETRETRYTWLMTVKNNSTGVANVNVAVFFRRAYGPFDEHVFSATNGTDDVQRVSALEYRITFDSSDPDKIPYIQRGGFLFDVENARWYRIQKVVDETTSTRLITLEEAPPNNEVIQHAMFPRGVVDVYPIAPKTP